MATRSTIAIQNADGSVTGIYAHWDGYLSHNGRILYENYNTPEKVQELIALGDLSSLGPQIGEKHPFSKFEMAEGETWDNEKYHNWCTAYGRDRGESDTMARNYKSWDDFLEKMGQEFNYLFVPERGWYVNYWDKPKQHLIPAMLTQDYE